MGSAGVAPQAPDPDAGHERLVRALLDAMRVTRAHFERKMVELGVPAPVAQLLISLGASEPVTMSELAEALRLEPPTITGIVNTLEEQGYVTRGPHPRDRRLRVVRVTPSGRTLQRRLWNHLLSDFPPLAALDPPQQAQLVDLLERLQQPPQADKS